MWLLSLVSPAQICPNKRAINSFPLLKLDPFLMYSTPLLPSRQRPFIFIFIDSLRHFSLMYMQGDEGGLNENGLVLEKVQDYKYLPVDN